MSSPVGGRGKQAPYSTKLVRIPEPLEPSVSELKSRYYGWVDAGGDPTKPVNWIKDGGGSESDGVSSRLAAIESLVERWESELAGRDLKRQVRWSQAARLVAELRSALSSD